jgi:hypothetical protein
LLCPYITAFDKSLFISRGSIKDHLPTKVLSRFLCDHTTKPF